MKKIWLVCLVISVSLLFGCASGAKIENMVYSGSDSDRLTFDEDLNNDVGLSSVSGGDKTNPLWTSEISNEAFSEAVKQSLSNQGLFSESGKYQLNVNLINVDQPLFGLDLKVTTYVKYVLTDTINNSIILDETIVADHTATIDDTFLAIKRLRLANEGSGKKNIEGLLKKLSELKINTHEISMSK